MSLSLDGTNAAKFTTSPSNVITASGASIISGWFRFTTLQSGDNLWTAGTASASTTYAELTGTGGTGILVNVWLTSAAIGHQLTSATGIFSLNTWYHITVVIQASAPVVARLYIGSETAVPVNYTLTVTQSAGSGPPVDQADLNIGGSFASTGGVVNGQIAQFYAVTTFNDTTTSTLSDEFLLNRFVIPMWNGTFNPEEAFTPANGRPSTSFPLVRTKWVPFDGYGGLATAPQFVGYAYGNETSETSAPDPTTVLTAAYGTPLFSDIEPSAGRRRDIPTAVRPMPLLLRR